MRVLHVYRTYFPDDCSGIPEAIRQISLATRPHGVESTVFTLSPDPRPARIARPEAEVLRARSWMAPASCNLGDPRAVRDFARLVAEADLVHYHFPWPFADVLHFAARPRVPALMTYHSDIVRQRALGAAYAPLMHRMLAAMRAIVATSPPYRDSSPTLTRPELRDRVRVIPLGIDEASLPAADPGILPRLGLSEGEPFLLFLGVLRYYKGVDTLIAAAARSGARVVLAGAEPPGADMRERARRAGAGGATFAGPVSEGEKVALLRACRGLVLPSHLRSEAFGMVLVEAAMSGRPMITCEVGTGTSWVNLDGETGIVVPPADPGALAAAMATLLADEPLAARYGAAARRRYEALFSGPALGRAYHDLYQELA